MRVTVDKLEIQLTRDEMEALWLDVDMNEIRKRLGETDKDNLSRISRPRKWDERTMTLIKA